MRIYTVHKLNVAEYISVDTVEQCKSEKEKKVLIKCYQWKQSQHALRFHLTPFVEEWKRPSLLAEKYKEKISGQISLKYLCELSLKVKYKINLFCR